MDPNELLKDIIEQARKGQNSWIESHNEMSHDIINLVEWLANGGFPPNWRGGLDNG